MIRRNRLLPIAIVLTLVALLLPTLGAAAPQVDNPALNPVDMLSAQRHDDVKIVVDGKPVAIIAIPKGVEEKVPKGFHSVRPAAREIRRWVKAATGAELPIVEVDVTKPLPKDTSIILLGWSEAVDKLAPPIGFDKIPREGFCTFTRPGVVVVAGKDGWQLEDFYKPTDVKNAFFFHMKGTLWGAYDFVERFVGVRFYYPGIGTVVPKSTELAVPACAFRDGPRFPYRHEWDMYMEFRKGDWPWDKKAFPVDTREMFARWRTGSSIRTGSSSHTPIGWPRLYGKARPELFWKDRYGIRHIGAQNPGRLTRYDISNPAVVDQYVKDLQRYYDSGWLEAWKSPAGGVHGPPQGEVIPFGLMDNRLDIVDSPLYRKDVERGEMTDVVFDFFKRLAEAIAKKWPEKKLVGWAYSNYRMPPTAIERMPENFYLQLCDLFNVQMFKDDALRQWYIKRVIDPWAKVIANRMTIYGYLPQSGTYPVYYVHSMVPYYRDIVSRTDGVYYSTKISWARDHINHYVRFRLSWDPAFNVDAALEEYYRLAYGKAAPQMKAVYTALIEAWDNYPIDFDPNKPSAHLDSKQVYGRLYPPELVDKVASLLGQALRAVPADSIEGMRVKFFADSMGPFFKESGEYRKPLTSVDVPMKMGEVTVDGKPDDPWWTRCREIKLQPEKGDTDKYPGTVKMCYDDKALYLLAVLRDDKPDKLKTEAQGHDGAVWLDDSVELFLAPPDRSRYVQIIVNAEGTVLDQRVIVGKKDKPMAWTSKGLEAKVTVEKDRWIVEMKLPWQDGFEAPPKPEQVWLGNVVRNKHTDPKGTQALSPTFGNNHDLNRWGRLRFETIGF